MSTPFGEPDTPIICPECGQPEREAPAPTSGNDEVEAMCDKLYQAAESAKKGGVANIATVDHTCAVAILMLRKQGAQIAKQIPLIEQLQREQDHALEQVRELRALAHPPVQSTEPALHIAICQAVVLLSIGERQSAHDILRAALIAYADAHPPVQPTAEPPAVPDWINNESGPDAWNVGWREGYRAARAAPPVQPTEPVATAPADSQTPALVRKV